MSGISCLTVHSFCSFPPPSIHPPFIVSLCSSLTQLSPCFHSSPFIHTTSLTVYALPIPLLLSLHLSSLSSVTSSSFVSPSLLVSVLVCEWWICGLLVIQHLSRRLSAREPDGRAGNCADGQKKGDQSGEKSDSYCSKTDRHEGRQKNATGRQTSREAALTQLGKWFDKKTGRLSVRGHQRGRQTDPGLQVGCRQVGRATRQAGHHRTTSPASQQARGSAA